MSNLRNSASGAPASIVVLGMHRSGTSLTAHLIHTMGLYVSDNLLSGDQYNEKGYWEDREIIETNALILHALGGRWNQPVTVPTELDWVSRQNMRWLQRKMRYALRNYPSDRPWVAKDPRFSLTLPLWKPLLHNPKFVVCVRNPMAVARSLERRNRIPISTGLQLWFQYSVSALKNTHGFPVSIVHYEDYFPPGSDKNPRQIAAFMQGSAPACAADAIPVEEDLQHHHGSRDDTLNSPLVPLPIRDLYSALIQESTFTAEALDSYAASLPLKNAPPISVGAQFDFLWEWVKRASRRKYRTLFTP